VDEKTFKERTKRFALAIVKLVETLPRTRTADVLGRQLLRSGTSVSANYRAACRGRSASDVVAKLGIVEEEADETIYWLELLADSGAVAAEKVDSMKREANELVAMTVASIKTLRNRNRNGIPDSAKWTNSIQNPKSKIQN
jgi:four helix bundle protein